MPVEISFMCKDAEGQDNQYLDFTRKIRMRECADYIPGKHGCRNNALGYCNSKEAQRKSLRESLKYLGDVMAIDEAEALKKARGGSS